MMKESLVALCETMLNSKARLAKNMKNQPKKKAKIK